MSICMLQSDVECVHVHTHLAAFRIMPHKILAVNCTAARHIAGVGKIEATGPGSGYKFKVGQRVVAGNW
jgi:hypothetical protein